MAPHESIARRRQDWGRRLREIESSPLETCFDFPEIARRWNAWWRFESDRPLLVLQAGKGGGTRRDKAFDLLDSPGEWLRVRREQLTQTHWAGEALPSVRPDIGPVAMGAFLGAPLHLAEREQTGWQTPVIASWDERPPLEIGQNNEWLQRVMRLIETVAADASGKYLVCLPDLTGAIDTLASLRGSERLCFDLHENRDAVVAAAAEAVDAWEEVFVTMYDAILARGTGVTQWVTAWADEPLTVPTCDFNALVGPQDFDEVCLPSLSEQARRAGLCVFHLDGPDAARHAESLARDPHVTAIQYTPGAGTPSALSEVEMLRMIQSHGKPLFVEAPRAEVKDLARRLDPRGLAIRTSHKSPRDADAMVEWRNREFG